MNLPSAFEEKMKRLLGTEYEDYLRNPAIMDRFLKIITSIYLQAWLKNDPRAGRNIHEFYYYGYAPKVSRQTRDCPNQGISPFPFSFETLIRQNQKYKVIKSIIVKQAKADHCYYKRDRGDKKLAQQTNYARKIPWIRLCILSKMAEGKLRILDFLLERKEPLIKGLRPKSNQYLYEYYQDYYDLYRLLDPKRKNENQITDIEYVALAIMLQEMEYSYRFHAAVMFAKMVKNNYPSFCFDHYKDDLLMFWGRFAKSDSIRPIIFNNNKNCVFEYTCHDILSYVDEMYYLCKCEEMKKVKVNDYQNDFLKQQRSELLFERQSLAYLFNIIPPQNMPEWNEEDYRAARHFFEREYPVYQVYQQACGEDGILKLGDIAHKRKSDTTYDYIREFLTWIILASRNEKLFNQESPGWNEINEELCKFRNERYTSKSKKRGRPPKTSTNS